MCRGRCVAGRGLSARRDHRDLPSLSPGPAGLPGRGGAGCGAWPAGGCGAKVRVRVAAVSAAKGTAGVASYSDSRGSCTSFTARGVREWPPPCTSFVKSQQVAASGCTMYFLPRRGKEGIRGAVVAHFSQPRERRFHSRVERKSLIGFSDTPSPPQLGVVPGSGGVVCLPLYLPPHNWSSRQGCQGADYSLAQSHH